MRDRREFASRLQELMRRGELEGLSGERYGIPKRGGKNLVTGRLTMHRDGFGFVIPESASVKERLAGDIFMANWEGRTVGDLFDTTRNTMPMNQPDSLTAKQYVDLVAYLLQANGFPAGKEELQGDSQALKSITIQQKKSK